MNKWINLFGTILITLVFAITIPTTITNPTGSNIAISVVLCLLILVGLWLFGKKGKKAPKEKAYDGFTPVKEE